MKKYLEEQINDKCRYAFVVGWLKVSLIARGMTAEQFEAEVQQAKDKYDELYTFPPQEAADGQT